MVKCNLFDEASRFCEESLPENSIYRFLARERERLFPDELFADLFSGRGRRSVPPSVVATVMGVAAAGWVVGSGGGGSVRVRRALALRGRGRRLRRGRLGRVRLHRAGGHAGAAAGLGSPGPDLRGGSCGGARGRAGRAAAVLDSTPLYDAVATMETVTLIRSAVRGLLGAADSDRDAGLAAGLRAVLRRGDDYATAAKPQIDWDDPEAHEELIDSGPGTGMRCWRCWTVASSTSRCGRRRSCWPRCWVRTWRPAWTGCCGSRAGWPATG